MASSKIIRKRSVSRYKATIDWKREGDEFTNNKYNRSHFWHFDGGQTIPASSSPQVIPVPLSDPDAVDPEEAFTASISSCHMLWFLSIAAKQGFTVDEYRDEAIGILAKNADGKLAMTEVILNPKVKFDTSTVPSQKDHEEMHHLAHEKCFISNSVKTVIRLKFDWS